jgi:O-succinylbenzoate synthase
MVDAVRSAFPRFPFHVDCNAAYSPADAPIFEQLDRYELAMIEQPLADDGMSLINHADLQRQLATPICLDESAHSRAHVEAAIRLGSCRVVNIKMARVGGLAASRDIQALCAEHGIPCWVGGMLESAVGGAICAELATLPNFTYAGDIFPSSYFYADDLGKPELALCGPGRIATSTVPGIAQEPDPERLARWTVAHAAFAAE